MNDSSEKVISTEEVIKGLKCCTGEPFEFCEDCSFGGCNTGTCYNELMKAALHRLEIQCCVIAKLEDIINGRKEEAK